MSQITQTELEIRKKISEMFLTHAQIWKNETIVEQTFDGYFHYEGKLCAYGLIAFRGGMPKEGMNKKINDDIWLPLYPYGLTEEMKPIINKFFKTRMKTVELNDTRKLSYYEIGSVFERYAKEILEV